MRSISNHTPTPTALLLAWGRGEQAAFDQLVALVHDELRRIARRHMRHERPGHSLQATALVNEAYLRLIDIKHVQWQNRAHFFAMSARVMRRILVDSARARGLSVVPLCPFVAAFIRRHPEYADLVRG